MVGCTAGLSDGGCTIRGVLYHPASLWFSRSRTGLFLLLSVLLILAGCSGFPLPLGYGVPRPTPSDFSQPPDLIALVSLEGINRDPLWSPNGSEILFIHDTYWLAPGPERRTLHRQNVASGKVTKVIEETGGTGEGWESSIWYPIWDPSGESIVFEYWLDLRKGDRVQDHRGGIYAVDLDGANLHPIVEGEFSRPSWSPDGHWIAFFGPACYIGYKNGLSNECPSANEGVYIARPDGTSIAHLAPHADDSSPMAWSPDGSQIAFVSGQDGNREIYVVEVDGSGERNLTQNPSYDGCPDWSPDGRKMAFDSGRDGGTGIFVMSADGSALARLTPRGEVAWQPAWSPDGQQIAFLGQGGTLYVMDADGGNQRLLVDPPGCGCREFDWSPDGMWIAFSCIYWGGEPPEDYAGHIYLVRVSP